MSRAIRRHHYNRMKTKRIRQLKQESWVQPFGIGPRSEIEIQASVLANTGKLCSCFMCRDPRNVDGDSLQERRSSLSFREQLNTIGENYAGTW